MTLTSRTRCTALLLAFSFILVAIPSTVLAQESTFDPNDIVFPVIGQGAVYYSNTFGAPRSGGRTHEGTDIMSVNKVKGREIVAVADGTVSWMHNEQGGDCCALELVHAGGWRTAYIHLDNDTPGTDDGQGWGFAPGIEVGTFVEKGQLIGYLGDSGNAEGSSPHLHFEIRKPSSGSYRGIAISSYEYLVNAPVLSSPLPIVWDGVFRDDDGSVHESNIEAIAAMGITVGCNPPDNDQFCPLVQVTRGQMAAFLRRALELPSTEEDFFSDDDGTIFEGDINAITAEGIGFGCSEDAYCSTTPLGRDEMAELLNRAFGYAPSEMDLFTDDDGNAFEDSINAIGAVGVTLGCNPPDNDHFCPDSAVTRQQMASFLVRAIDLSTSS